MLLFNEAFHGSQEGQGARCSSVVRWVVGSILHGGPIELFLVPAGASTTGVTNFIYGYMAREETRCRHIGYSFRLAARVLLYASSHRQDNTYHSRCYTSRGALAGTRISSMGPP